MSSSKGATHVVSIIVYGAKGLKPKKDKHKFCVIFGIGKTKFRTDIVEDLFDNPVFNKEVEITVHTLDLELKFKITEKHEKDILGQVLVPLYELGDHNTSSPHKVPLRPHKKCPTPSGLLIFEAWVTAKVETIPSKSTSMESLKSIKSLGLTSGLKKLKERIAAPGKSSDAKHKKNSSESLFSLKTRSAVSCQDMTRDSAFYIPADRRSLRSDVVDVSEAVFDTIPDFSDNPKRGSLHLDRLNEFSRPKPEITSVMPKMGPETGGTVLTIRGSNLGENHEDITALSICGSDVLETLEYISPWKLQCKTLPWKPCVGSITLETLSGGRSTSSVQFTFTEMEKQKTVTYDAPDSYSAKTSLPDIYEENVSETNAGSTTNLYNLDGVGLAVPYSDTWVDAGSDRVDRSSFEDDPFDTNAAKYEEKSNAESEDVGVRRFSIESVEKNEFSEKLNNSVNVEKEKSSKEVKEDVAKHVSYESSARNSAGQKYVAKTDSLNDNDASKPYASNGFSENVPEKNNRNTVLSSGQPVKQPPPVVEILPMRVEEKNGSATQDKMSSNSAPRKPPRQFPDRRGSDQAGLTDLISEMEDAEKRGNEETDAIKDLEKQLFNKNNEIEMLLKLKKGLQDENWRLKQYIEALIMRAIKVCPEVLCIDDSFA